MRLLNISNFKKRYLEKTVAFKTKVCPTLIRIIRDMEDGLKDYRVLNLCNSGIDDEQLAPLLETLRDDINIQILNLSNNQIRSLEPIIQLLKDHTAITRLDLSNNPLSADHIPQLIETARANNSIVCINLKHDAVQDNKLLLNYTFDGKASISRAKPQLAESPARKKEYRVHNSLYDSLDSTNNSLNSLMQEPQSMTAFKEDARTNKLNFYKGKMSRMEWILHLKKIFDEIKKSSPTRVVTAGVIIEHITANISLMQKLPLVDENIQKQSSTEIGFSVDEIVRKLRERQKDIISYDDLLDAISQINKKIAKTNNGTVGHTVNPSSVGLQNPGAKPVPTELAPRSKHNELPNRTASGNTTIHLREQKTKTYLLGNKNPKNLNYTDNQLKSNHSKDQDLLDELYAINDKKTTVDLASSTWGSAEANSDFNSSQHLSADMHKISDCSAIEHTERSDIESDWLAGNDSNSDIKRVSQPGSVFSASLQSQHSTVKTLSTQSISSPTASNTHFSMSRARNEARQLNKVPSVEINRVMRPQPHFEESQQKDSNSKNKSVQMLKHFLNTKTRPEQPVKPSQNKSYTDEPLSFSENIGTKNDHSTLEFANSNKTKQRPPLSLAGNSNSTAASNQSLITPRNANPQKVPITKVSLGKNSENPLTSPSRTSISLRESIEIAKAGLSKGDNGSKPPAPQSLSERSTKPVSEFYAKFLDLLTNFNTFYNENSSLISSTDISFINMINGYALKSDSNNQPKVGVCFTHLESTEVKDMLIYPLLRTILCYVEILRIKNSTLSQDSFSELIPENLLVLNLSGNNISDLRCLKTCRNLEFINLHDNSIEEVKGFIMCPKIKEIVLSSNKLRVVKNLSKLSELRLLDLSDNLIDDQSSLKSLQQNTQLRYLNLKGNPLTLRMKYRKEVLDYLPQLSMVDVDLQKVSEYARYGEFSLGKLVEEVGFPKKLAASKSFAALTTASTGKRGVLKNSASNLNLHSSAQSYSRSITPSAVRKTSFFQDLESSGKKSRKDKQDNEEILTINLDINNLDS